MKLTLIALVASTSVVLPATAQQQVRTMRPHADTKIPSPFPVASLPPAPIAGGDSCSAPEVLPVAGGVFTYTNASATTGTEGQGTVLGGECGTGCQQYAGGTNLGVPKDVWFSWTPAVTGRARISDCGQTNDTKIAVYNITCAQMIVNQTAGAGICVACNDDYHNDFSGLVDAGVTFNATAGTTFLIQVGNSTFTPAASIAGSLNLEYITLVTNGQWDDNTFDDALGVSGAGDGVMMMQGFKAPPGIVTVPSAQVSWLPGSVPLNTPITVAIYDDPNDDQNPNDCVLLSSVTGVAVPATNTFVTFTFPTPVPVSGDYFIAVAQIDTSGTQFPWTIDEETCQEHPNSSWFSVHTAAAYDIGTVGNPIVTTNQALFRLGAQCTFGTTFRHSVWAIRADQVIAPTDTPFTSYCSGDGTDTPCPCTNPGVAGRGCENTVSSGGALITSTGIASIAADTLVMHCAFAVPFGPGLYYEGNARPAAVAPFGISFGNGLRCAAGATNRLEIRFADNTGASNSTVSLSAFGAALASTTYHYQMWYRDTGNVGSCNPGAGFNLSNAISLTWAP